MMFNLTMMILEKNWPCSIRSVHPSPHFHFAVLYKMDSFGISGIIVYSETSTGSMFSVQFNTYLFRASYVPCMLLVNKGFNK